MTVAAFFDLDRTLLTVNSGALWVKREREQGRIGWLQVANAVRMLGLYHLGLVNMDVSLREALGIYRGLPEADIARWTQEWYERDVAHRFAPGAERAVEEHRRAGHTLVLLTSSSPYLSRIVGERLGLDAWLCQGYEVVGGCLTGEPCVPLCYGAGKVTHAEKLAAERGLDLTRSYFYSDSFTDLPMLERVGEPRVVNPDIRLRLTAIRRRWPVVDWSR